jgi:uncharacterized membrane protein
MNTRRIETLVDGIFAIAMTLLVLSIGVPNIPTHISEAAFQQQLFALWPKIAIYALSFWVLAIFWRINHQQFYLIKKSDRTLLNINILFLLFIALMPFSTEILGEYGHFYTANILFHVNLLLAGIMYYINWYYASYKNFLDKDLDKKSIDKITKMNLILPLMSIIAIGLSFYIFAYSSLIYLTSIIWKIIIDKI